MIAHPDAQEDFRRLPRAPQPTRSRMSRPAGSASARTAAPVLANGIRLRPVSEIRKASLLVISEAAERNTLQPTRIILFGRLGSSTQSRVAALTL